MTQTEPVAPTREIADLLGDMISAHAPDGTYSYASAAAKELLGYEPSELVGTWAYDHMHPSPTACGGRPASGSGSRPPRE